MIKKYRIIGEKSLVKIKKMNKEKSTLATISAIIGVITMTFSILIYELDFLWLLLDLIGMIIAYLGLKKGDTNCRTGLILCGLAAVFSFGMIVLAYLAGRQ